MDFKIGETVTLKSGGPDMTIEEFEDWAGVKKARCRWFDEKNKPQTGLFSVTSLKLAE